MKVNEETALGELYHLTKEGAKLGFAICSLLT